MIRFNFSSRALWNTILLIAVIFVAFILPVLPSTWHRDMFRAVYTVIYFTAILSLEKRSNYLIILMLSTLMLEWLSGILKMPGMYTVARGLNLLFFLVIVFSLIRQIATAKKVTAVVILGSIAAYLLVGVIYSMFIGYIMQHDPGAFNVKPPEAGMPGELFNTSVPSYYGFVTLATLGYGDIVPLKPYSRSLATFIAISGQLYIAIIIALLVGKYAAKGDNR